MPTYAYACTDCDHHFEARQSFTDDALTECPKCEGRLRKLFNAVGVVFKGSGFYRTDSRSAKSSTIGSGSSKSNDGGSADSAGSSESTSKPTASDGSGSSGSGSGGSGSSGSSATASTAKAS